MVDVDAMNRLARSNDPDPTLLGGIGPAATDRTTMAPTGEQHEIERDGTRVVATEVGATLRVFEVDGRSYLDTFETNELVDSGRGQMLVPFPNRIADGRYRWNGQDQQLPINEVSRNNAIHGLARWLGWHVRHRARDRITLGLILHPQEGYPFGLDLAVTYTVRRGTLLVRHTCRNLGPAAAPFGVGFHPYFTVGTPTIDCNLLQLPATSYFLTDDRLIPTGKASVAGTPFDFREPRPIGDLQMDTGFADVLADADGWARVTLSAPDGPRLVLLMGQGYDYFQVFTGDALPAPRRRTGLAIEPYSCATNAFNNGLGLITLAPGQQTASSWGLEVC